MKQKRTSVRSNEQPHLGGNIYEGDELTFTPECWSYVLSQYKIKSVLDVGSGRGFAAKWFSDRNLDVTAIDGLEDNIKSAIYPTELVDLTKDSYSKSVDLVNCVEVVEHIYQEYLENLLDAICCGKYLLMTHAVPGQRGYHHVNCQPQEYWVNHVESRGYRFLEEQTNNIRKLHLNVEYGIGKTGLFFEKI
jgi:SAM-dependent methyltransferase